MFKSEKLSGRVVDLLLLVSLAIGLGLILENGFLFPKGVSSLSTYPGPTETQTFSQIAYPAPQETASKLFLTTPSPTPNLERETPTPLRPPTGPSFSHPPIPPTWWPKEQNWPPEIETPTSSPPEPTEEPFPTPALLLSNTEIISGNIQLLWYLYYQSLDSDQLKLHRLKVDNQGNLVEQSEKQIQSLSIPYTGNERHNNDGPTLRNIFISPDHEWILINFFRRSPELANLSSLTSQPVFTDQYPPTYSFGWLPDSQHIVVQNSTVHPQEIWLVDALSQNHQVLDFPRTTDGFSLVQAVSYSPDGEWSADAVVYPPTFQVRDDYLLEIGLHLGEKGERKIIAQIEGGHGIAGSKLEWSHNSDKLMWTAVERKKVNEVPSANSQQIEIWLWDRTLGASRVINVFENSVEDYNHLAAWSPDDQFVAVIKEKREENTESETSSIYVIDIQTGAEKLVTQFQGQRVSNLQWSPNGQLLAFTLSKGEYGEIWVTDLNDRFQYPIAGPTTRDAPFVWLP
jgi:hypothetical protein